MSIISSFFYDRMLAATEEACLRDWRRTLLKNAAGNVLEIGAGTGANLGFYTDKVEQLTLTEPDKHMRRQLQKKLANTQLNNTCLKSSAAENIDAADDSFDFVTSSLVCCSIVDPHLALLEIKRVLKPGGQLILSTPNRLATKILAIKNPYHIKEFSPDELKTALKTFGKIKFYGQRPLSRRSLKQKCCQQLYLFYRACSCLHWLDKLVSPKVKQRSGRNINVVEEDFQVKSLARDKEYLFLVVMAVKALKNIT